MPSYTQKGWTKKLGLHSDIHSWAPPWEFKRISWVDLKTWMGCSNKLLCNNCGIWTQDHLCDNHHKAHNNYYHKCLILFHMDFLTWKNKNKLLGFFGGRKMNVMFLLWAGNFIFLKKRPEEKKRKEKKNLSYLLNMSRYLFFSWNQKPNRKSKTQSKAEYIW